ncbi:MAG: lamin tail domain-containing protein, partial [Flavobacteriales bacterium]
MCGDCGGSGYAACTDPGASNYDAGACVDDLSCIYPGCTDSAASNYDSMANEENGSCLYATTFNVDMNCPFNPGALLNGSTEINDLFVTGPLLGWAANEGYNQLTDPDGDNIFSVTLDFPAGDIEYKYAVNGFADQENLIDDMQNGADCAPVTDYAGYANRLVAAGSSTNDIFGSCTICSEQVVDVTFSVDVSNESFDYVTIAGTFNGWNNGANPMNDDDGDGIYTITLQFPPNSAQEYKFLGNGNWGIAELFDGSESCTTGPGEYINRVVQVPGESIVLDTVCYNLCEACAPGCTNDTACNYDDSANVDNGSCEYVAATELPNCGDDAGEGAELGLFFSGYAEGSSNNKFLEIYNPTGDVVSLDGYAFPNVSNAPNVPGEYEYWNAFPAGASIAPGDVYVIAHPSADPAILAEADHTFTYLSNGDDGFILVMGSEEDFVQIDAIGDWNGDPGSGWEVAGQSNGTQNNSLIRKADVTSGNGGDWAASAGTNEEDSEWIVLPQDDWTGLGSHDFAGAGGPT